MPSLVGMNCLSQGKPTYSESILKPRLGDSVTLFSRIHTKALGFLSGLCLLGALCLQGCTEPPKASLMDRITLAPTAVTIPLERLHQDVLDARAPLDTFVCLKVKQEANVEVKIEVDTGLTGAMTLLDATGKVLDMTRLEKHRKFYSMRGWASVGAPSQCLRIELREGWSMVSIKWRER